MIATDQSQQALLAHCTRILLDPQTYPGVIHQQVHIMHQIFARHAGISAGSVTDEDMNLPSGNAVSPIKAAHCLLEFQRTAIFLRGIYQAIIDLKMRFPGERLHILYAGCGPYATLLTPLTSVFSTNEVAFHLLDVNPTSVEAAQRLYTEMQLNDYVEEWLIADATTYQIPAGQVRHLIISETMLNALRKEPQVAIMLNLLPQLPVGGQFIPHQITVSAQLLNATAEHYRYQHPDTEPERLHLADLYTIGTVHRLPQQPVEVPIPQDPGNFNELSLLTHINTYGTHWLQTYECSLNMPVRIAKLDDCRGKTIRFTYHMGQKPGFEHQWV